MKLSVRRLFLVIVAVLSIALGIVCLALDAGSYFDPEPGVERSIVHVAWNVKDLAKIVKFGFGSVLIVAGLTIGGAAILPDNELLKKQKPQVTAQIYAPSAPPAWQMPASTPPAFRPAQQNGFAPQEGATLIPPKR